MKRLLILLIGFTAFSIVLNAQDEDIENLLNERVVNENPVYKPMIGLGSGVFNFYGDVRNNYNNPVNGNFGYKFNVATYLDKQRYLRLNLFFLYGEISANERSLEDPLRNLNFQTDIVDFGINFEYSFHHLYKKSSFIKPFISIGIENLQFTPKGDVFDSYGQKYYYWTDGSIRDIAQGELELSTFLNRDFNYETDLRQRERKEFGLGDYSQNSLSIPIDLGINFKISDRVNCKLATSVHYTFSDFIDNVSSSGTSVPGNSGNDFFLFNYFSLDFDLFSEPKELIIEKMFAELDFDEIMFDDEDGDFILDPEDECPGTPYGIAVDTLGCPLDQDKDGIADYLDKDNFTPEGAWVDADGIEISEEKYLESLLSRNEAMNRQEVKDYFETIGKGYIRKTVAEIPDKFKVLDADEDGYISFEELLLAIDNYFDQKLNLKVEDIYELNNFFFSQ